MNLGKFTKVKNYYIDCEPSTNGSSIRFYNPDLIEKEGELWERQLFNTIKEICNQTGFKIPKKECFSVFIVEGETI